jgi:transmembrane protein TMEM174 (potassium channel)
MAANSNARPLHGLATLWPSYLAYVVTFMLIGQVWANHHVMFDHIRSADRVVLFLNTVLLMDIAFLPFAASATPAVAAGRGTYDRRTGPYLKRSTKQRRRLQHCQMVLMSVTS